MNFYFAAFTYLHEWVCYDRYFLKAIALSESEKVTPEEARRQLAAMATHYGVMRNFKIEKDGTARLSKVWSSLMAIDKPVSQQEAIRRVDEFVAELKLQYGRELVSAASKILWFRFQSHIIIFDSLAVEALTLLNDRIPAGYGGFYDCWRTEFRKQEDEIRTVCGKLSGLSGLIEFLDGCSQEALEQAMSSAWFRERVFDHALMNYALDGRSKHILS